MMLHTKLPISILLLVFLSLSCAKKTNNGIQPIQPETPTQLDITTVLTGYEIIWGFDFLPNGDMLFAEKQGKLYRWSNNTATEITGLPTVRNTGQGGLLDIRIHPDHASNGWIYAAYSATGIQGNGELRLIRFRITGNAIRDTETLFQTGDGNTWNGHYGSRICFDANRNLYLAIGEGGTGSYGGPGATNKNASNPAAPWGKIHRLTDNGGIPSDNPILPGQSSPTSVFAYGVRNPQGMVIHPETGQIWEAEHGPKGGDEINLITKGGNYGWPNYSLGTNYDGTPISQGHTAPNIIAPIFAWVPSIGTSGIGFITHSSFKTWKGHLLVGGLAAGKLYRCVVDGNKVVSSEPIPGISGRVRHVASAPDGSVYVSVENPGRILRMKAL